MEMGEPAVAVEATAEAAAEAAAATKAATEAVAATAAEAAVGQGMMSSGIEVEVGGDDAEETSGARRNEDRERERQGYAGWCL